MLRQETRHANIPFYSYHLYLQHLALSLMLIGFLISTTNKVRQVLRPGRWFMLYTVRLHQTLYLWWSAEVQCFSKNQIISADRRLMLKTHRTWQVFKKISLNLILLIVRSICCVMSTKLIFHLMTCATAPTTSSGKFPSWTHLIEIFLTFWQQEVSFPNLF